MSKQNIFWCRIDSTYVHKFNVFYSRFLQNNKLEALPEKIFLKNVNLRSL